MGGGPGRAFLDPLMSDLIGSGKVSACTAKAGGVGGGQWAETVVPCEHRFVNGSPLYVIFRPIWFLLRSCQKIRSNLYHTQTHFDPLCHC